MFALIFIVIFGGYALIAYRLSRALHRKTGKRWIQVSTLGVLIFAPLYDVVIGYFVFERFAHEHPGIPVNETHTVESVLITGRKVSSPSNGLWRHIFQFPIYEYRREDVAGMSPRAREQLRAYVQFREVGLDDATCLQPFRDAVNPRFGKGCVGVTTTDQAVSRYEVFREPDGSKALRVQLNSSSLFPIYGAHSYVRDLTDGRLIAENWHMAYYLWWLDSPETMVFSRHNPGGRESYETLEQHPEH